MEKSKQIIAKLTEAYWAEMETVQNYTALSVNLDGIQGRIIAETLSSEISEELGHARELAKRIKELGGQVPGSTAFQATQKYLQTPADSTNVLAVINGVLKAEEEAISLYREIIRLSEEGSDYVTQDLAIRLLADEEEHQQQFQSFLAEFQK